MSGFEPLTFGKEREKERDRAFDALTQRATEAYWESYNLYIYRKADVTYHRYCTIYRIYSFEIYDWLVFGEFIKKYKPVFFKNYCIITA